MAISFNKEMLSKKWVHSHEEDSDSEMVYRPADYNFPPSRGRRSLELKPDGSLVKGGPGADDRRSISSGSWKLQGDSLFLTGADAPQSLKISSLSNDKLVFKK